MLLPALLYFSRPRSSQKQVVSDRAQKSARRSFTGCGQTPGQHQGPGFVGATHQQVEERTPQSAPTEEPELLVQANLKENPEQATPEVVAVEPPSEEPAGSVDVSPAPLVKQKASPGVPSETKAPESVVEKPAPRPSRPSSRVGGLLLSTLSVGGAEVKLSNKDGYLRICREPCIRLEASDLVSGSYETRVVPKGGGRGIYLSVRVKPGQVCRYNLKGQGEDMDWEERGCE